MAWDVFEHDGASIARNHLVQNRTTIMILNIKTYKKECRLQVLKEGEQKLSIAKLPLWKSDFYFYLLFRYF